MKFAMTLVVATSLSANAYAQESNTEKSSEDELVERCVVLETLAESIMTARQAGTKMSEVREAYSSVSSIPDGMKIIDLMMIMAYEQRRELSKEPQRRAIESFRDEAMLSCLKGMREPD